MKNFLLLLTFLYTPLYCNSVFAQYQPGDEEEYAVLHYTEDSGLPQNSVKNIAPDSEGFIWITTETGLVRFDGKNFVTFDKSHLPIPNNRFSMLQPDLSPNGKSKKFYAVADNDHYIRVEGGKAYSDSLYFLNKILKIPFLKTVRSEALMSNGSPNYLRDWANPKYFIVPVPYGEGNFYICYPNKIEYYANWNKQLNWSFKTPKFWNFFLIGKTLYFAHTDGNITSIQSKGLSSRPVTGDILKNKLYNSESKLVEIYWNNISNQVFFYLDKKLYEVSETSGGEISTRLLLENYDFAENNISSILYDKPNERFFLGSVTKGLFLLKKKTFMTLRSKGSNLDNVFYGQAPFDSSAIITGRGFIFRKDKVSSPTIAQKSTLISTSGETVDGYGVISDRHGNIWRKSGEILYCFNLKENRIVGKWVTGAEINHIYEGQDGTIWLGTREKGLYCINLADVKPQVRLFIKGPLSRISFILEETPERLVVATAHGLFLLELKTKKLSFIKGTEKLYIRSLYVDDAVSKPGMPATKNIWLTTYEDGFFLFSNKRLTQFPVDKNKYLKGSHCIFPDNNGFFWITTNKGLFKVSREDLLKYAGKAKTDNWDIFYDHYTKEQGFHTNEFNGGCQPCAVRLANGYVSLPSLDGLVWFVPEKTHAELPNNKIVLDRYDVGGISTSILRDTIKLPIDPQQIKIHFSTAYFGSPSNLNISYAILRDSNKKHSKNDWIDLDVNNTAISIGSLTAGNYTLYIRKINGFGKENYTIKKVALHVPPSWYETLWFRVLAIFLFALAVYLFVKLRLRLIQKENQALEIKIAKRTQKLQRTLGALEKSEQELQRQMHIQTRLIASMSHDINTPLKFVSKSAGRIDSMLKNEKFDNVSELGKTIEYTTSHMHHLLENLIIYVKTQVYGNNISFEEINLAQSLSGKFDIFKDILTEKGNHFITEIDTRIKVNTNPQLLGIIVHNLIDNANKVTANGVIRLYSEVRNGFKHLIIADSGPGMPDDIMLWLNNAKPDSDNTKQLPLTYNGLGLTIVKEISTMLRITILTEAENGTNIHLIFPDNL